MTYIDGYHDKQTDRIYIVERDQNGKRHFKDYPVEYTFYYSAPNGVYTSIYKEPCAKFSTQSNKTFRRELNKIRGSAKTYESDIKPVFRRLEESYKGTDLPILHTTFFDIEVDFHDKKGFASPDDPFNIITAISLYNDWENTCYTLVLAPPTTIESEAKKICDEFENTFLCDSEESILAIFLELIEDADILSGWNSEGFDIPYVVGRIMRTLGRDYAKQLCHWNLMPKARNFERYGKEQITYDLFGRVHLDYLQLYRKNTFHEMHSYSLDSIGEYELKEKKVAYEGSLDDLYKYDFRKFIEYNRQDTMLLAKLDKKLKFIHLTNTLAHENCVLLPTTMGAVGLSDNGIILECHERGVVVPDRAKAAWDDDSDYVQWGDESDEEEKSSGVVLEDGEIKKIIENTIAGAYVANPKKGLNQWVGSVDITSLYPSVIMALNISPETIVGQLEQNDTKQMLYNKMKQGMTFADAWSGVFSALEADKVFERSKEGVVLQLENAKKIEKQVTVSGQEARVFLFESGLPYCLSANGTIFNYEIGGIIPGLLEKWFEERKETQKKAKDLDKLINGVDKTDIHIYNEYDIVEKEDGKLYPRDIEKAKKDQVFFDQRQHLKKIQLNSLYGAITNPGSRFFDQRMGQSITLTGRNIARHMAGTINQILTGEFDHQGQCISYGDTDSAYFTVWPIKDRLQGEGFEFNEDSVVTLYDGVAEATNSTFAQFMEQRFNCHPNRAIKIKANREICAKACLFVKKKRYAALMFDKEGVRYPEGKLKIMGMDTQRADTPTFVQNFLKDVLKLVLSNHTEVEVINFIQKFRKEFRNLDPWKMGTPKRCNGLTKYSNMEDKYPGSRLPGHIRAAYNWNKFKRGFGDNRSMDIIDGGKTIVCKLKSNNLGITSIAYPIDQAFLPDWFKELPFDKEAMEFTLIDKKIKNLIGVLKWNLDHSKQSDNFKDLFDF